MAILFQRPDATRVAGYQTWRELGRYVKRGEKGIAILAPVTPPAPKADGEAEEAAEDEETKPAWRTGRPTRFRVVYVFDISSTDGAPLPESPAQRLSTSTDAGRELYRRLSAIAAADGIRVETDATLPRGVNGECDPAARVIRLARGLSEDHRARTFCHELAHAWLHDIGGDRAQQEAEAEGVAYVVATWAGLQCDGYSFGYVAGWAKDAGGAAILTRVGATIQKTAARMIERLAPAGGARGAPECVRSAEAGALLGAPALDVQGV